MNNYWFIADTHFKHSEIIKYSSRPFLNDEEKQIKAAAFSDDATYESYDRWINLELSQETVNLHDETLVKNWNSLVQKGDTIFHLGDCYFTWRNEDRIAVEKLLSRLNGAKFLIKGNHDRKAVCKARGWQWVGDIKKIKVDIPGLETKQKIILCHYAMKTWQAQHHGSWQLYGHSHGNLLDDPYSLQLDVGVDCWDYYPVSLDQIKEAMDLKEVS